MPHALNRFTDGMNRDATEEDLGSEQYRDALNVQVSQPTEESYLTAGDGGTYQFRGAKVGRLANIQGTEKAFSIPDVPARPRYRVCFDTPDCQTLEVITPAGEEPSGYYYSQKTSFDPEPRFKDANFKIFGDSIIFSVDTCSSEWLNDIINYLREDFPEYAIRVDCRNCLEFVGRDFDGRDLTDQSVFDVRIAGVTVTVEDVSDPPQTGLEIIGYCTTANHAVLFTTASENVSHKQDGQSNYGQLWYLDLNDPDYLAPLQVTLAQLVYHDRLDFALSSQIKDAYLFEYNNCRVDVAWHDGFNRPRLFQVPEGQLSTTAPSTLGLEPESRMATIKFRSLTFGDLREGVYRYAYRYVSETGATTPFQGITEGVNIFGNTDESYAREIPQSFDRVTSQGVVLKLSDLDTRYAYVEVAAAYYISPEQASRVYLVARQAITSVEMQVSHVSFDNQFAEVVLTETDLYAGAVGVVQAKSLVATTDNRLLLANFCENTQQVFNQYFEEEADDDRNPQSVISKATLQTTDIFKALPADSLITGDLLENPVLQSGNLVGQNRLTHALNQLNPAATSTPQYNTPPNFNVVDDYVDYKGRRVASELVGYWRGETYRFGIVLHYKDGSYSPAYWIGDHQFGTNKTSSLYSLGDVSSPNYTDGQVFFTNQMGLQIGNLDLSGIKDQIQGFAIVRASRDETVLAQGVGLPMAQFQDYEKQREKSFSNLQTRNRYRLLFPVMGYDSLYLPQYRAYYNDTVGAAANPYDYFTVGLGMNFYPRFFLQDENNAFRCTLAFYSPEVDFGIKSVNSESRLQPVSDVTYKRGQDKLIYQVPADTNVTYLKNQEFGLNTIFKLYVDTPSFGDSLDILRTAYVRDSARGSHWDTRIYIDDTNQYVDGEVVLSNRFRWLDRNSYNDADPIFKLFPFYQYDFGTDVPKPSEFWFWQATYGAYLALEIGTNYESLFNTDGSPMVFNVVADRDVRTLYGGKSESALNSTTYITTGHYQPVDECNTGDNYVYTAEVWGGDCIVQPYDRMVKKRDQAYYMSDDSIYEPFDIDKSIFGVEAGEFIDVSGWAVNPDTSSQIETNLDAPHPFKGSGAVGMLVPLETTVNVRLRQAPLLSGSEQPETTTLLLDALLDPDVPESFKYERVWSHAFTQPVLQPPGPTFDPDCRPCFPNRMLATRSRNPGSFYNQWSQLNALDFLDLNLAQGAITHALLIDGFDSGGRVYFLQEQGFGYVNTGVTQFVSDQDEISLTGTASFFSPRPVYISTDAGTLHKHSVVGVSRAAYWWDAVNQIYWRHGTQGLERISETRGMRSVFHERLKPISGIDNPLWLGGIHSAFDYEHGDLLITYVPPLVEGVRESGFALSYNESAGSAGATDLGVGRGRFTSFLSAQPRLYLMFPGERLYSPNPDNPNEIHQHYISDQYNLFYGEQYPSWVTFIVAPNPAMSEGDVLTQSFSFDGFSYIANEQWDKLLVVSGPKYVGKTSGIGLLSKEKDIANNADGYAQRGGVFQVSLPEPNERGTAQQLAVLPPTHLNATYIAIRLRTDSTAYRNLYRTACGYKENSNR